MVDSVCASGVAASVDLDLFASPPRLFAATPTSAWWVKSLSGPAE
jgi:hypothetical protein